VRNGKSTAVITTAIFIAFVAQFVAAQIASPTDAPPALAVPEGLQLVLSARGVGSQIYTCRAGTDSTVSWTLKAPQAELRHPNHNDKVIGQHFAGPTWKLDDGSEVTGNAAAHIDSPDAGCPVLFAYFAKKVGAGDHWSTRGTAVLRESGKSPSGNDRGIPPFKKRRVGHPLAMKT
jgi:hypothetical protein